MKTPYHSDTEVPDNREEEESKERDNTDSIIKFGMSSIEMEKRMRDNNKRNASEKAQN